MGKPTGFMEYARELGSNRMPKLRVLDWKEFHEHLVPGVSFRLQDEPGAQLFYVLYFLATGLHAVHLTIGIAILAVFAHGSRRLKGWAVPPRIEAAGLYWHFVDVVWIFLYPLIYLGGRSG